MGNAREYYVVSRDGTVIAATDCLVVHLNREQLDALDAIAENDRFVMAKLSKPASPLDEIMHDLIMSQE